nr:MULTISPECIES: hypothetical protein [unclassified Pseudomonas]
MVRAILEGRKTVTRRAVRAGFNPDDLEGTLSASECRKLYRELPQHFGASYFCPYGQPGDRLWVRETWYCDHFEVMRGPYLKPDDLDIREALEDGTLVYGADGLAPYEQEQPTWKPSIHMPRWASRILLEITDVRVERLQDITEEQAKAEGVRLYTDHAELGDWWHIEGIETYSADPRKSFELLWTSVGGDWDANPWVWVVEFKRVTP